MIRAAASFLRAATLATVVALPNVACTSINLRGGTIYLLPGPFLWVSPATVAEDPPHPSELKEKPKLEP